MEIKCHAQRERERERESKSLVTFARHEYNSDGDELSAAKATYSHNNYIAKQSENSAMKLPFTASGSSITGVWSCCIQAI